MPTLRSLRAASAAEIVLAGQATVLLHAVRLVLWRVPYRRLLATAERVRARPGARATAAEIGEAMRRAARAAPGSTCLVRALAAYILCRRAGVQAELCIGVARGGDGSLEAHAWLRSGDRVLVGDRGMERYVPLRASVG
jgi:hypothetical protein